jgi:hypothetical protein
MAETLDLTPSAHEAAWREMLHGICTHRDVAAVRASLPSAEANVAVERDASGIVAIVTRATLSPHTSGLTLSVRHLALGPFDEVVEDFSMPRETVSVPDDGQVEVRLAGRYAPGDRVLVRVDVEGTALDAPMRLAAVRLTLTPDEAR